MLSSLPTLLLPKLPVDQVLLPVLHTGLLAHPPEASPVGNALLSVCVSPRSGSSTSALSLCLEQSPCIQKRRQRWLNDLLGFGVGQVLPELQA